MFTTNHFIWLFISLVLIITISLYLKKIQPPLEKVLKACCVCCVLSEFTKTFSTVQLVPSADGSMLYPYIEMRHIPLHLCSLQIRVIFFITFTRNEKAKKTMLGFLYPTAIAGAVAALFVPTIFDESVSITRAFTHPLPYQYFLYHTMLIILGIFVMTHTAKFGIEPKHYLSTLAILGLMAFFCIYFNSMFADAVYENGVLQSVDFTTNFLFVYTPPVLFTITKLWHWYAYVAALAVLAVVIIALFYIPVFKAGKKAEKINK